MFETTLSPTPIKIIKAAAKKLLMLKTVLLKNLEFSSLTLFLAPEIAFAVAELTCEIINPSSPTNIELKMFFSYSLKVSSASLSFVKTVVPVDSSILTNPLLAQ